VNLLAAFEHYLSANASRKSVSSNIVQGTLNLTCAINKLGGENSERFSLKAGGKISVFTSRFLRRSFDSSKDCQCLLVN